MDGRWWRGAPRAALIALGLLVLGSGRAEAQWVGEPNEVSVSLASSYQFASRTFEGSIIVTGVPAQSWQNTVTLGYVPLEKLKLEASLVSQMDRYTGPQTTSNPAVVVAHGSQDDGDWHGNLTDATLIARYQLVDGGVTVTPFVVTKLPVTDYESLGYAASGTGLKEVGAGAQVGRIGLGSERVFLVGGYQFRFVEKESGGGEDTEQFRTNYSLLNLLGGYFLGDKLTLALGGELRWTHDGFELKDYAAASPELRMWHDPVLMRKYVAVSAVASYALSEALAASLLFSIVPWGDNVSDTKVLGLELSWTRAPG